MTGTATPIQERHRSADPWAGLAGWTLAPSEQRAPRELGGERRCFGFYCNGDCNGDCDTIIKTGQVIDSNLKVTRLG